MRANALLLASLVLSCAGCGVAQADECKSYVACQKAYDEAFGIQPSTPISDYEEGGRCWHGNPATAETCARSCESTREALSEAANAAGQRLDACESPAP